MKITEYRIQNNCFGKRKVFALVSDLHGGDHKEITDLLKKISPDAILAPGDIFEPLDQEPIPKENEEGFALLEECARIAPTY